MSPRGRSVETSAPSSGATASSIAAPVRDSVLRTIWGRPFLRAASLALFISGIGVSATMPQMTLFLVEDMRLPLGLVGLYYLVNLMAPIAGFAVGTLSERIADRLLLYRVAALVGAAGWLAMACARATWMPFVIGALLLSVGGVAMGQLFAAVRDELLRRTSGSDDRVIATMRMSFSAGWIIGPVLGSWFGAAFGLRPLLVATAVCMLAEILPLGTRRVERFVPAARELPAGATAGPPARVPSESSGPVSVLPAAESTSAGRTPVIADPSPPGPPSGAPARPPAPPARPGPLAPLLLFLGCCVLVQCGDSIKFAYLPIFMHDGLGLSDLTRGTVISVQPLLELVSIPLFARLAERWTAIRVMTLAATFGIAAHLCYASAGSVGTLLLGQLFMSGVLGAFAGLGITVAQQLCADRIGLASSLFSGALPLASALGGCAGAFALDALGMPHLYYVPAVFALVGFVGLLIVSLRFRPSDAAFAAAA